jgi:hypothetical protein
MTLFGGAGSAELSREASEAEALRDVRDISTEVDALALNDPDDFDRLDALAVEFFRHPQAAEHLGLWFRLYERFPESDGHGVFWSILHGIEAQPGYEQSVVESVLRNPTHFPVLMVNRLINGRVADVGGVNLFGLLRTVAEDERASPEIREDAAGYLAYQRGDA